MNVTQQQHTHPMPGERPEPGAGERLRQARNAAGLSVVEVGARLHLDGRTVRHIEADEYERLPAPTFVRGYLRSYARLLDLPPGPIMEAFDRHGFEPPALIPDISNHVEAHSGDFPVRLVTYFIVIGLAALVIVWWHNQRISEGVPSPDLALEAPAVPGPEPSEATRDAPREPPAGPQIAPRTAAREAGTGRPRSGAAPLPPAAPAAAATAAAPAQLAPPADAAPTSGPENPAPAAPQPAAASPSRAAVATPPAPAPAGAAAPLPNGADTAADVIRMRFEKDSWVEVYDRSGERLYYNLASAGDTLALHGQAPFRVVLGYARGVDIEYNGVPFDQTPYISREVARFRLGDAADSPPGPAAVSEPDQTPGGE